jgi:hypothetical protein
LFAKAGKFGFVVLEERVGPSSVAVAETVFGDGRSDCFVGAKLFLEAFRFGPGAEDEDAVINVTGDSSFDCCSSGGIFVEVQEEDNPPFRIQSKRLGEILLKNLQDAPPPTSNGEDTNMVGVERLMQDETVGDSLVRGVFWKDQ